MQFQIPLALFALFVGIQAAPAELDARFRVTGSAFFCASSGEGPFGANDNGCADVVVKGQATQLACVSAQTATTMTLNVHNPNDVSKKQSCPNSKLVGAVCGASDGSFNVVGSILAVGQKVPTTCPKTA